MAARRILLTRPRDRAEAFARTLVPEGWTSTIWPLTEILPVKAAIAVDDLQGVLFTSRAGVLHAPSAVRPLPAYCVGDATAAAAHEAGHPTVFSAKGAATDLIALAKRRIAPEKGALLHIRGRDAAGDLGGTLRAAGYDIRDAVVYAAEAVATAPEAIADDIRQGAFAAAAFFSPRASAIFAKFARDDWRDGLSVATAFAISENAASPLRDVGFGGVSIAEAPTAGALRAAICGAVT
ncbi:MAG: uroporphyrinogen-III synthase [Pseudomonadota bacterium]